jgi:hypothetical protein
MGRGVLRPVGPSESLASDIEFVLAFMFMFVIILLGGRPLQSAWHGGFVAL